MANELRILTKALRAREPLALLGPAGCGKTRIIEESVRAAGCDVVFVRCPAGPHNFLIALARVLFETRHGAFLRACGPGFERHTSVHLKGVLWKALEEQPVTMVLDGIDGAGFPTYRFLQRLYYAPGMAMFAASRDSRSLGALGRLFWNPQQTIHFKPLSERECAALFEAAADHFGLRHLNLEEFREKVLESAAGNPGQIIEMCRLATDARYISGRYVKFAPLRIDAVIRLS